MLSPVRALAPARRRPRARRHRRAAAVLCLLALFLASLTLPPTAHAAGDEYDALRGKWNLLLTGAASYDPADPDFGPRIAGITSEARGYWSTMDTTPGTYLWPDLASTTDSAAITGSYNRIRAMALAYSTAGSGLYQDGTLIGDISTALDWMYANRYNAAKTPYANWWDWEIGAPLALTDTMVMVYDRLSATQRGDNLATIGRFQPTVTLTGANRVWESTIIALRGILGKDGALITAGRDGLDAVLPYVASGDGFSTDGSYIMHDKYSYLGGYGAALLENLSKMLYVLKGSSWPVTSPHLPNVYRWVYDTVEPLIYKGAVLDMTRGRDISRHIESEHLNGQIVTQSVLLLAEAAPAADAAAYRSMLKHWIAADTYRNFYANAPVYLIARAKAVMDDPGIAPRPVMVADRQFPGMSQAVHRRATYGYAISMSSSRTANYESINSENLKGWYTGDGETYLYNDDLSQFSGDYQPTVDPYRRPGTTVDTQQVRADSSGWGTRPPRDWVGGTSLLGTYGASGMDLAAYGNSLTAKKSWFMFDNEVVALGAGITSTDNRTIETIVENRKLNAAGDNAFTVDGAAKPTTPGWSESAAGARWAHLAGSTPGSDIGYWFPGGEDLRLKREWRSGTWSAINRAVPDPTTRTAGYLTMAVDHGANPAGATYAYAVLPGKTAAQTAAYSAAPAVSVLANTATVQAVRQSELNMVAANFWADGVRWVNVGGTGFLSSDKKASVLTKESAGRLDVSLSDPTQANTGSIQVEINRSAFGILSHDSRITVTQLSPTVKFTARVGGTGGTPLEVSFGFSSGVPMDDNLALGKTATASSSYLGAPAWGEQKSTDGDRESLPTSMGWSSNTTLTADHSEWIQYDLGATASLNTVDLYPMRFGNENSFPLDVRVDVSSDGANWTPVATRTGIPVPGPSGVRMNFASVDARYVRINGTSLRPNPYDGNRYRMQLAEVEIRGTDRALGRPVSASSSYGGSGWGTAKATDGRRTSTAASYGWSSDNTINADHAEWITVDLGAPTPVNTLDLAPVTVNGGYGFPPDFKVEVSTDGAAWGPVLTRSGYPVPAGVQHFSFPTTTARYLRVTGTHLRPNPQDLNLYRMQFAEIEVR